MLNAGEKYVRTQKVTHLIMWHVYTRHSDGRLSRTDAVAQTTAVGGAGLRLMRAQASEETLVEVIPKRRRTLRLSLCFVKDLD